MVGDGLTRGTKRNSKRLKERKWSGKIERKGWVDKCPRLREKCRSRPKMGLFVVKSVLTKCMEVRFKVFSTQRSAVWAAEAMWEKVLEIKSDNPPRSLLEKETISVQDSY